MFAFRALYFRKYSMPDISKLDISNVWHNVNKPCMINETLIDGTEGRTRTDTEVPHSDFESDASTNFATPAWEGKDIGF